MEQVAGWAVLLPSAPGIMRSCATTLILCGCACASLGQQNDVPLNRDIYYDIDRNGACRTSTMHTGLRPMIESRADLDNVMGFRPDKGRHYYLFTKKLFAEHLINARHGGFKLSIDPVFRFEMGRDMVETSVANTNQATNNFNARGFWIKADLGKDVSFQTTFYENQAVLPLYLYQYAQRTGVVPGQGRIKAFNQRGLDFAWAMGNVSWSPRRWINVQFGNGRHFVGNGYRSVLLGDNTFPYPYLKFSFITPDQRLQYTWINARFQSVNDPADRLPTGESAESLFWWRRVGLKHLSVNLGPVQLGLFEATLWRTIDSSGVRPFNAWQLNPVPVVNTLVNGFDGEHKQLIGLDAKYRITDKFFVYGQFALDDPARQRYAWQAGFQWFDILVRDLHLLAEYNSATPFAYTSSFTRGSYSQYNEPLASPLGAGYNEAVAILDYGIKQTWWFRVQGSLATFTVDTTATTVSGGNIFDPRDAMGADSLAVKRTRAWLDVSFAWRINHNQNTSLSIGLSTRDVNPAPDTQNCHYLYVCLRTGLFNRYYDH